MRANRPASPPAPARSLAWRPGEVDELVAPALRSALGRLAHPVRTIAEYHFGWRDTDGAPADAGIGKMIRPALVLLSSRAAGGRDADAVPAAVAVELLHNFSLLHDDIMDGDRTRRHRPAAWTVYGVPRAVLAGDALLALSLDVLADRPARELSVLHRTLLDLVNGQAADISFEQRDDVSLAECEAMVRAKTGSLIACSCSLGAFAAGARAETAASLAEFGWQLGRAFQLIDDVLGIWGEPGRTGKSAYSDLAARKKTLPVAAALASDNAAARELAARYRSRRPLADSDLDRVASLVVQAGGRAWAEHQAAAALREATAALHRAHPAEGPARRLNDLADFITRRDH
ncbi:geranylgeranyl diphosphate synthase type I [Nocardiopsis mwathae]|uniref:Geranylgeranyl diphosphate synthase type I n=1 Tax=Nocardiopsis mwathae TaxID=1472723 RepID=A0A7X0D986_9ACTN|nr:polyprenyl synthetase family protein [Nocardiopsis mwathae]MBB6174799.1 geranylgeranyl diphosphate synthase type I [Nocardiopsis mwathae]